MSTTQDMLMPMQDQRADAPPESVMTPGELGEIIASFNDVTLKLERSHEQLRAEVARLTRDLTEANAQVERSRRLAALGEMAAGIAHEVRNPLGSIRLYARMLEQDLADRAPERKIARKITGASSVIEAIVGDVLTFAKEFRLHWSEIDCMDALERAIEACRHDGVPGWAHAEIDVRREGGVHFEGDANLVHQALVNVLRNAFEAIAESSSTRARLRVSAARRLDAQGRAMAVLRIQDSGPGVTPDVVSRMFNPFFTTRSTGTGLGLAIVHRIMDAHAGGVSIRNNRELGGEDENAPGACVELVFPRSASVQQKTKGKAA